MLTVIIPHHLNDNQHLLDLTLASVLKQDIDKEVIVVADTKDKPIVPSGVMLHWAADNRFAYPARKFNFGARIANPESTHLFFGSDDIVLGERSLLRMKIACEDQFIINALSNADDINFLKVPDSGAAKIHFQINDREPKYQYVVATNRLYFYATMVPRRAYETIGPFDEIFEAGWEDEDYCIRASIAGFRLGIDTSSYIYHKGGQTVSKAPHNPKNKEHFKKKWGIDLIPSATMPGFSMITAIAQKMNDLGVTIGGQVVTMGMVNKTKV